VYGRSTSGGEASRGTRSGGVKAAGSNVLIAR
jgi:hypothetical protein